MGYSTEFFGTFALDRPLAGNHADYLRKFADTRRMKRDPRAASKLPDPNREAACLLIGPEAGFFVGGGGYAGQEDDASVVDFNAPPSGQPGLWCQWVPTPDGSGIEWDGGEKFYRYVPWIKYLNNHFLIPWGYRIAGSVRWRGEDFDDVGMIVADNGFISLRSMQGDGSISLRFL